MRRCLKIFCLSILILTSSSSHLQAGSHPVWEWLTSPKGLAWTTFFWGELIALPGLVWAFRWNKHLGFSDEENAQIQEIGGLISQAAATIAPFIAFLAYECYSKHIVARAIRLRPNGNNMPVPPFVLDAIGEDIPEAWVEH